MSGRFATALTCFDGRAWPAVVDYMSKNFHAVHVDVITAPAMPTWLAQTGGDHVRAAAKVSLGAHDSVAIAVAGHADCAVGPEDEATTKNHIRAAMEEIATWELGVPIVGLYVDGNRNARKVAHIDP